jgi:hypothetical protein
MNILEKANEIVNERSEEKERQYGPFQQCMLKTAKLASIMSNKEISIVDAYNVLVALKMARQSYAHKEDNLLDAVAYLGSLNNFLEKEGSPNNRLSDEEYDEAYEKTLRPKTAFEKFDEDYEKTLGYKMSNRHR